MNPDALIEAIQSRVSSGKYEFSEHALTQSLYREIEVNELREAIRTSELVEDYPEDKYGPSCLLLGRTLSGRPLHIQVSYPNRQTIKIITVYEPDPAIWVNFRKRKGR